MDVFVIPVGPDKYELYCEQPDDSDEGGDAPPSGIAGRLRQRVAAMLRAAEERRHREPPASEEPVGWVGRLNDRMMSWVVERIAEQRLLWNLRRHSSAVAVYPPDLTFEQVMTLIRRSLQRDRERHQRWMIVDGVAFLATFVLLGPLFLLVPGVANLPALFFGFRVVGHWFSMRGASQGLHHVEWSGQPCPPLTELREAATLEPRTRAQRVHEIAAQLRLQHLSTFFERMAA